jgi:hypothetical protein
MNQIEILIPKHPYFKTALWEDFDYRPEDSAELYKGQTFTGMAYDYDTRTGSLIKEESYWDGGVHGFIKMWYPNGQVKFETRYFHGGSCGESRAWYDNGLLKRASFTWGGHYVLKQKIWDEYGKLIENYRIQDNESDLRYYIERKKHNKATLHLRRNWASTRHPGLIDFNKQIQLYLRENPFIGIEPKQRFDSK